MRCRVGVVLGLCIALSATGAQAEEPANEWLRGVSEQAQREAERLVAEGTELYVAERFLDASVKYQASLELVADPQVHFTTALCLMQLARWLDAAHHFERSLAYGEAALGAKYERARAGLAEAVAHTGTVVVTASQRGALLSVDGKSVLTGPGTMTVRLEPGKHIVIAKRGALISEPLTVEVTAGHEVTAAPLLYVTRTQWRWPTWRPWTVVGVGALGALTGVPMLLHSQGLFDDYRGRFRDECATGCRPEPDSLVRLEDRAYSWQNAAIGAFVGGGIVVGLGLLWVGVNHQVTTRSLATDLAIVPLSSQHGLALVGTW